MSSNYSGRFGGGYQDDEFGFREHDAPEYGVQAGARAGGGRYATSQDDNQGAFGFGADQGGDAYGGGGGGGRYGLGYGGKANQAQPQYGAGQSGYGGAGSGAGLDDDEDNVSANANANANQSFGQNTAGSRGAGYAQDTSGSGPGQREPAGQGTQEKEPGSLTHMAKNIYDDAKRSGGGTDGSSSFF